MNEEKKDHAETPNEKVCGDNQERKLHADRDSEDGNQEVSSVETNNSISSSGNDRSRRNTSNSGRTTISGGIIRQLVQETDDQLKESIARVKKLQQRREQLMELFHELSEKTGETWDDADAYLEPSTTPEIAEEE